MLLASREDAWYLLGGSVTHDQLETFRELAVLVLAEDDPALELPQGERWLANVHGKVRKTSSELQKGLVESLVLMSVYDTYDKPRGDVNFKATVYSVMNEVLPEKATWQRWASLGRNLTTLVEAAPNFFLERVEEDLASKEPELPKLFQDCLLYTSPSPRD